MNKKVPPRSKYYAIGLQDARRNRYPLYATLLGAGRYDAAREYARGWSEVTGRDIRAWRDGVKF